MIYYKNGQYHISTLKVHYKEKDEGEVIKYIGQEGKEWWEEFAKMWPETFELIDFIETEHTEEQKERLDKVNELNLPEGISFIDNYVMDGSTDKITKGHPLYIIKLSDENEMLSDALIEISMMTAEKNEQNEAAIVELATMIGGMM